MFTLTLFIKHPFKRFYYGLGLFALSASTIILITDPFKMLDLALMVLGVYLMTTAIVRHR